MEENPILKASLSMASDIPLYAQLTGIIKNTITSGTLRVGDLLPSEAELCDKFEISRNTVRQAIGELEEEGLISAVPRPYGQAYFVTPQGDQTLDMFAVRLPGSLRDKIAARAAEYAPVLIRRTRFATKVERDSASETARRVTLRAMEPHGDLVKIELLLPDEATARHACDVWEERSQAVFSAIYSELTRE